MTDYQITCSTKDGPDPDYRIDSLGGPNPNGVGRWHANIDDVLAAMDDGDRFWVVENGKSVWAIPKLHASGRRYVTTEADGFPPNNLLNLPDCP